MDFFTGLWSWFTGSNILSSLAKTALLGYASRLLNDNVNQSTIKNGQQQPEVVDKGVRLQLDADTQNKIPVLYGEAYFGGYLTDARISADYSKMTYCLALCEITGIKLSTGQGATYTFLDVFINNNKVYFKPDGYTVDYTIDRNGTQDVSMQGLIKIYVYGPGGVGVPPSTGGSIPSAYSTMPGWSAGNYPMTDLLYAIIEITYNKDKAITGLPNCLFHIKSDMTLVGDVLADYMLNPVYGAGIPGAEIDGTALSALNAYSNTGFSYTNTSGQSSSGKFDINGLIDTNTPVLTNMEEIVNAAGGWISYNIHAGMWTVVINKLGSIDATFDDSNIVGEISISGTSLTQIHNVADVKYQNTDILDKTDYVKISLPEDDLFTNEPRSSLQISLPFTNRQSTALKVGLLALKQARVDKIIKFTADYSYINLTAGQIIGVTSAPYGFTNKPFRIITTEEVEGDGGEILVSFTALEYDEDVYSGDISDFLIETDDGIFNINAIGKPDVPIIRKFEKANIPAIEVDGKTPSGIVESLQYWISFDTQIQNDEDRTYVQFSTFRNKNGILLSENQICTIRYTQLNQGQFYIKIRGVNAIVTGPFSDPTTLIPYNPVVVGDTVSDEPTEDSDGNLMPLGLLTLLSLLNGLMSGGSGLGSLFDKIFEIFEDVTGYDILGSAEDGSLAIDCKCDDAAATTCKLTWAPEYPKDRATYECPEQNTPGDVARINGNYSFIVSGGGTLSKGTGNVYLYKSNGQLFDTVPAANLIIYDNRKVFIPFKNRIIWQDYYILADKTVITSSNGCLFPGINFPYEWNLHTDTYRLPIPGEADYDALQPPCPPLLFVKLEARHYWGCSAVSADNQKIDLESNIGMIFNQPVTLQPTGLIKIIKSGGAVHQEFNLAHSFKNNKTSDELVWISTDAGNISTNNMVFLNPTIDFDRNTRYYVTMTANCVKNKCGQGNEAITAEISTNWFRTDNGPDAESKSNPGGGGRTLNGTKLRYNLDRETLPRNSNINVYNSQGQKVKSVSPYHPAVKFD